MIPTCPLGVFAGVSCWACVELLSISMMQQVDYASSSQFVHLCPSLSDRDPRRGVVAILLGGFRISLPPDCFPCNTPAPLRRHRRKRLRRWRRKPLRSNYAKHSTTPLLVFTTLIGNGPGVYGAFCTHALHVVHPKALAETRGCGAVTVHESQSLLQGRSLRKWELPLLAASR